MDEFSAMLSQETLRELNTHGNFIGSIPGNIAGTLANLLPSIVNRTKCDCFVQVLGEVSDVDVDQCFTSRVCWKCCTEITSMDTRGIPVCSMCNIKVSHPSTRLNMVVELKEASCKDRIVQIDLTQTTIQSLLPSDVPADGFDMDRVLGKRVQAVAYIQSWANDCIRLYQIDV